MRDMQEEKKQEKQKWLFELVQQCVTESGGETLLKYVDKSDNVHVKVDFAGLSISHAIGKDFKYHKISCQSLTQSYSVIT